MAVDTVIRGGTVALPDGSTVEADVLIDRGKIAGIVRQADVEAAEMIDASGKYVLPGIIDPHVHIGFSRPSAIDFETESRSAALGGVTTMLRYYRTEHPYGDDLQAEIRLGEERSHIDWALHLGLIVDEHLENLPFYVNELGIRSFKMYTCYKTEERPPNVRGQDDGFIREAFERVGRLGGAHINVHCENEELVRRATARVKAQGEGSPLALWSAARPPLAEAEAIRRVAFLAQDTGCPLYVVHISSREGLEALADLKSRGHEIYGETCAHYLALDTSAEAGLLAKVNPPVRPAEDVESLWAALAGGTLDTVGTDHAGTMRVQKGGDIWSAAPGFPGMGTLLPSLFHFGVNAGRIGAGHIARLQARTADIFRLPGKGRLLPGHDADLVIVDPALERTVDAGFLQSASDFSVFEGQVLRGWPVLTMLRGTVIAADGKVVGRPGFGRYLAR